MKTFYLHIIFFITVTFTVQAQTGPGGVSGSMEFWYKGNAGTSTTTNGAVVTSWADQSSNGNDATQIGTGPLYNKSSANYNPELNFDNSITGGFEVPLIFNITSGATFTTVIKTGADISTTQIVLDAGKIDLSLFGVPLTGEGFNLYIKDGNLYTNVWNLLTLSGLTASQASIPISSNTNYIITITKSAVGWVMYINGTAANAAFNLSLLGSFNLDAGIGVINGNTLVGGSLTGGILTGGNGFKGTIKESVYYTNALSTINRNRVETYMALKYGITLTQNYTNSNNTVSWNVIQNVNYGNDITGISSDPNSDLAQKQSYTVNDPNQLITIGLKSIEADNISNSESFAGGRNSLIWGHNNGSLDGIDNNSELVPGSGDADYLKRDWKLIETGEVDSVYVSFSKVFLDSYFEYPDYGNFALKIADDSLFQTNVVYADLAEITINGTLSYGGSFDFDGVKFLTLAQRNAIIWATDEWRGGLSQVVDHGPSDEPGDSIKGLYIDEGDTAFLSEAVKVNQALTENNAVLVVNPGNCLNIKDTFSNSGQLFLNADETGYSQYKGPQVEAKFRQYIDSAGWHLISSPFSNTTWSDFTFLDENGFINHPLGGVSLDSCTYCNLHYYDPSADNGSNIGFGATNAFGTWRTSANSSENFIADKGWILNLNESFGFSSAPWTVELTGMLNNGQIVQTVNENNGGWNLVANPYPSTLNWDLVDDDLAIENIAPAYHIWDEDNQNFAVYANGVGTLGATSNIAPMQGFYIQTETEGDQNSGDVLHTFTLDNNDRPENCTVGNSFYKTQLSDYIRLSAKNLLNGTKDETIIQFEDSGDRNFRPNTDIRKLFGYGRQRVSLASTLNDVDIAINQMPYPLQHDSVFITIRANDNASLSLELSEYPDWLPIVLEDRFSGRFFTLTSAYKFTHVKGLEKRFILHFGSDVKLIETENIPFKTYINSNNEVVIDYGRKAVKADWQLVSVTGQLVRSGEITYNDSGPILVNTQSLKQGLYFIMYFSRGNKYTQKLLLTH